MSKSDPQSELNNAQEADGEESNNSFRNNDVDFLRELHETSEVLEGKEENEENSDEEQIVTVRTKKRVQILSDNSDNSDDEADNGQKENSHQNINEESEQEDDQKEVSDPESLHLPDISEGGYKKLRLLCDEDSSDEEQLPDLPDHISGELSEKQQQRRKELDLDSSEKSQGEDDPDSLHERPEKKKRKSKKKEKEPQPEKPKKMSKKEKQEEEEKRNEVYSMIQRNAREETIEIPYHRPEQYELKEFLSRLQQTKEHPVDQKLAKKTGKLRSLKAEKISVEKDFPPKAEIITEIIDEGIKEDSEPLTETAAPADDLDSLVADTSGQPEKKEEEKPFKRLTLQGDPNSLIDLDSGLIIPKEKPKQVILIEKCISHNAKSSAATAANELKVEHIPGVAYQNLMNSLQQELLKKKKEQMQKYLDSQEKEKLQKEANEIDNEAEFADDFEDEDKDEKLEEVDEEIQKDPEIQDKEETEEVDEEKEENEQSEDEDEASDAEDEDSEAEDESGERKKKLRKRILALPEGDDDSDDEGDKVSIPTPSIPVEDGIPLPALDPTISVTETQMERDEMELFNLCTGNFDTQAPANVSGLGNLEDLPEDIQPNNEEVAKIPDFESSDDENPAKEKKKNKKARIYLSDDEEDIPGHPEVEDDEEDEEKNEDVPDDELNSNLGDLSDQEEPPVQENVEYDSEENEVDPATVIPLKPKVKVSEFMENEAELSESEWGSADEDEKDLDKLEAELGDEDQFDQDQLQSELERIHMKKLLDQDAREVKMVKNLVLHEEEREGMIRERTFRWLHVEQGFNLTGENPTDLDELRESDDENEEQWRKIRYERDVLLKSKQEEHLPGIFKSKRVTIVKPSIPEDPKEVKAPTFLVPESETTSRKSLLLQDDEYLSRLAILASKTSDVLVNGATEKGSFVFRQLSKPDEDQEKPGGKRKSENAPVPGKNKKRKKTSIYG
ncbi:hypothetical protein DMENIID0001_096120 [Sergentomyia squamirostris]